MGIMEKEGVSSADRPQNIAASDILSGGKRLLLLGVGERFRMLRKYAEYRNFVIWSIRSHTHRR